MRGGDDAVIPLQDAGGMLEGCLRRDREPAVTGAAEDLSFFEPCPEGEVAGIAPFAVPDVVIALGDDIHDGVSFC